MNSVYSEAAMGYHDSNKSELKSVVYTERDWDSPNLVAYMESHDEERLMYRSLQYGNSLGSYNIKQLPTALDRIELNSVFFIPFPGPKMIWQFGELGYDYSIDYNGRTGEKPVEWGYAEETDRTDLFRVMSKLNYLKQTYEEFSASINQYNLTNEIKTYQLESNGNYVVAVGNFGLATMNANITFPKTGTWYDYFAETTFSVTSTTMSISLQPGEYKLLTSRQMQVPHISTATQEMETPPSGIKIYPNPCTNELQIHSSSEIKNIHLLGIDGKLLKSFQFKSREATIKTDDLNPGFYILRIADDSNRAFKFIKR